MLRVEGSGSGTNYGLPTPKESEKLSVSFVDIRKSLQKRVLKKSCIGEVLPSDIYTALGALSRSLAPMGNEKWLQLQGSTTLQVTFRSRGGYRLSAKF